MSNINTINIVGSRFGKLIVIRDDVYSNIKVWVKCDYGKEKLVRKATLKSGDTKSCVCLRIKWSDTNNIEAVSKEVKEYLTYGGK